MALNFNTTITFIIYGLLKRFLIAMSSTKESISVDEKEQLKIDVPVIEINQEFVDKVVQIVRQFFSHFNLTKRSWKASLIRILIITAAAMATIYVCMLSSQRYLHSWVQTVIESTDLHVSAIPFPAVTICPIENFSGLRLNAAKQKYLASNASTAPINDKDVELLIRAFDQTIWSCLEDDPASEATAHNIEADFDHISQLPWKDINLDELFPLISYTCEELFEECTWHRLRMNCCHIFKRIETYKGICFSFNSILAENPYRTWPWKLSEAGIGTGLKVKLRKNLTHQYFRKIATMIHDPSESLSTDIIYMDSERVIAAVSPLRFTAAEDIRGLAPEYRHCYFMNELKLMGKSTSECLRDCRMNYIEQKCNCSYIFAQSSKKGHHSYPICGPLHMKCIYQHRNALMTTGNIIEDTVGVNSTTLDCKCYPNCNYIRYGTAVYSDNMNAMKNNRSINLQIYYQQDTLFSYHSMLPYTFLDLLVAYGGIAGLFLGLSLIGIVKALSRCITCWQKNDSNTEQHTEEVSTKK